MSTPLRVFLLDDHDIVRRGVRALLESEGDVQVVGDTSSVAEAETLIPRLNPDVAVLDARLPDGSGIELCGRLRELAPEVRCLVLTSYDDEEAIVAAIQAGAAGYVLKEVEGDSLLSSVRAVGSGPADVKSSSRSSARPTRRAPASTGLPSTAPSAICGRNGVRAVSRRSTR